MEYRFVSSVVICPVMIFVCLVVVSVLVNHQTAAYNIINKLNSRQMIKAFDFTSETHTIKTQDGYLLEVHRIPWGRKGPSSRKPDLPPVFIQHGLECSSASHIIIGPDDALPFLLADLGFDVWLGNSRGNTYSRGHVTLNPDKFEFWNYTWHDAALNDIPAQIDFVLEQTGKPKLVYVGHSMGTTMYFVLMSTKPEYNRKIELGMLMAPVAYISHTRSPLLRYFAPLGNTLYDLASCFGIGNFIPETKLVQLIAKHFCEAGTVEKNICGSFMHILSGDDPRAYDSEFLKVILNHFPEGYSVKAINHYIQLIRSERFRMYDYGTEGNMRQYGRSSPPDYDVTNIKTPMIFYAAGNDYLGDLSDVKVLAKRLTTLKELFVVPYSKFGHMDFLFGRNVKKNLYDKMTSDLLVHFHGNVTAIS